MRYINSHSRSPASHHEIEPHDIVMVLFFMFLIITKVTVDRNEVISTKRILYFFLCVCVLS